MTSQTYSQSPAGSQSQYNRISAPVNYLRIRATGKAVDSEGTLAKLVSNSLCNLAPAPVFDQNQQDITGKVQFTKDPRSFLGEGSAGQVYRGVYTSSDGQQRPVSVLYVRSSSFTISNRIFGFIDCRKMPLV